MEPVMKQKREPEEPLSPARETVDKMVEAGLLDDLMSKVGDDGLRLTGEGGFLPELTRRVLEAGLQAELTDHLGYEKHDRAGWGAPNSRNGSTPKTMSSEIGDFDLDTPRDRAGSFDPRLVPKGARRVGGLSDMIISLYAGGMTIRDIQHHLASTLGTELSHETISNITEAVAVEVKTWQSRPLEPIYTAPTVDVASTELDTFADSNLGKKYPATVKAWRDAWERFIPFLEFAPEVRRIIYTTNAIESLNYQLRKIIKNRGHFPSDDAVIKLLWLAIRNIEDKRARDRAKEAGRPKGQPRNAEPKLVEGAVVQRWAQALGALTIAFGERLTQHMN